MAMKSTPREDPKDKSPEKTEVQVPDRHFSHDEPESDYSMDELDRKEGDLDDDPNFEEFGQEQDDDE
jgi:hypothetical protein